MGTLVFVGAILIAVGVALLRLSKRYRLQFALPFEQSENDRWLHDMRTLPTRPLSAVKGGFYGDGGDFTADGVPYVVGEETTEAPAEEPSEVHEGATEDWSPIEETEATVTDSWKEAQDRSTEDFLRELNAQFDQLQFRRREIDDAYDKFRDDSMNMHAYRQLRLEHTGEIRMEELLSV